MNGNNTWVWVGGIIVVILIIGGLFWWMNGSSTGTQAGEMATTTDLTASTTASGAIDTSGTNATEAPIVPNTKNSGKTVAQILAGLPNASEYASLLASSGASISGKGPYTVFVSTDAGYALLKPGTITSMTAAQKKRLAQYSVVSGKMLDVNTSDSGSVKALSGDELNFNVGSTGLVQVNSSYALAAFKGSNGIVYIINQPLVPPTSGNILTP